MENDCQAGCKAYYGGEVYHHKHCKYYPDSLSQRYDELKQVVRQYADGVKCLQCGKKTSLLDE